MDAPLFEQCRQAVRRTLANQDWQLVVDDAAFVDEVASAVQARPANAQPRSLVEQVEHAARRAYGRVWHAACRSTEVARQQRAFEELHDLLYRVAYHRLGDADLAADSAQNALVNVWKNLDRVDNPASFVWWALRILDNEVNQLLRAGRRQAAMLLASDLHSARGDDEVEWLPGQARLNGSSSDQPLTMTDDIRAQLERAIRHCLGNPQHQAVIIKNYLDDKSYQDIAAELGTTPQNVAVYKQRGLRHLRECDEFLTALETLL